MSAYQGGRERKRRFSQQGTRSEVEGIVSHWGTEVAGRGQVRSAQVIQMGCMLVIHMVVQMACVVETLIGCVLATCDTR